MTVHELQFHRSRVSGNFRALCSCGWCRVGPDEQAIRGLAGSHDIEWEAVEAPAPQPAAVAP